MLFKPKETKFSKQYKGRKFNKISSCVSLQKTSSPMEVAVLKALNHARFPEKLLLTIKQTLSKKIKKQGKFSIKLLADVPVSKKPLEIRMGKGKGAIDHWVAKVVPGAHIIEIHELSMVKAVKLLREIQKKLPIHTKIKTF
jgi:large subunit ribosomal protein L16